MGRNRRGRSGRRAGGPTPTSSFLGSGGRAPSRDVATDQDGPHQVGERLVAERAHGSEPRVPSTSRTLRVAPFGPAARGEGDDGDRPPPEETGDRAGAGRSRRRRRRGQRRSGRAGVVGAQRGRRQVLRHGARRIRGRHRTPVARVGDPPQRARGGRSPGPGRDDGRRDRPDHRRRRSHHVAVDAPLAAARRRPHRARPRRHVERVDHGHERHRPGPRRRPTRRRVLGRALGRSGARLGLLRRPHPRSRRHAGGRHRPVHQLEAGESPGAVDGPVDGPRRRARDPGQPGGPAGPDASRARGPGAGGGVGVAGRDAAAPDAAPVRDPHHPGADRRLHPRRAARAPLRRPRGTGVPARLPARLGARVVRVARSRPARLAAPRRRSRPRSPTSGASSTATWRRAPTVSPCPAASTPRSCPDGCRTATSKGRPASTTDSCCRPAKRRS